MSVTILIADDHALVRDGIRLNLGTQPNLSVVGEAVNGREAIAQAEALRPTVVIMDIAMPEINGIEATRLICQHQPDTKVLILSMHYTLEHCFRAIEAGARGYLLKESAGDEVVAAVRAVSAGQYYFGAGVVDPRSLNRTGRSRPATSPLDRLTPREREIFQLVVDGKSSTEIGEILGLSPKSVDTYRSRLMQKLGTVNLPALVRFALQHGITPQ